MKIDAAERIAGVPLLEMRAFLRRYRAASWTEALLREQLGLTADGARALTGALVAAGYIAAADGRLPMVGDDLEGTAGRWQTTARGNALAAARTTRVARAVAERHLRGLLARVEEVNRDARWLYRVRRVVLFGSYLDPAAATLGDVDAAIELAWKGGDRSYHGVPMQAYLAQARAGGRRFCTFLDQLAAPEEDVRKFLKGGSRILSFHPLADLDALGGAGWAELRHQVIFEDGGQA